MAEERNTVYRHSLRSLGPDLVRAGAGLLLTLGPLAVIPTLDFVAWTLGGAAAAFGLYTLHLGLRLIGPIRIDAAGIAQGGPLARRIDWARLSGLRLRYFSTRRDREKGWLQLTLRGMGRTIRIESTLPGFDDIVGRAAKAAVAARLPLDAATLGNFQALGIDTDFVRQSADPDAGFVER